MLTFHEDNFKVTEEYQRQGRKCLFDPIREILVPATPEEYIRQKLLKWLKKDLEVPDMSISCEDHLSHYKKGERDRADIVIKVPNNTVLLLIECKEPGVALTNDILERQVYKYAQILKPKYIMLTNGNDSIYQLSDGGNYIDLRGLTIYEEMLKQEGLKYDLNYFDKNKPIFNRKKKLFLPYKKDTSIISPYMDTKLADFTANLYNCLMNEEEKISKHQFKGLKLIKDGGLRKVEFGNAGGGSWSGYYRYFIVRDHDGNNQIISFNIETTMEMIDDPVWGNRKGYSYFLIAIDDFKVKHLSIELRIDKYVESIDNDRFCIWHDGRLTAGKYGSVKPEIVLNFVENKYPELIKGGRVELGTLNNRKLIHINDPEVTQFFINCIKYVLVRDECRKQIIQEKNMIKISE